MKRMLFTLLAGLALWAATSCPVYSQNNQNDPGGMDPEHGPQWYLDPTLEVVDNLPYIDAVLIGSSNVTVKVVVPEGVTKVTLESRSRMGSGAWIPRVVKRITTAGSLTFQLPKSAEVEVLRVRGECQDPLPIDYYLGNTNFNGQISTYDPAIYYPYVTDANGSETGGGPVDRSVVESDIWSIHGNTLYFFNQYRGLQIVDLTLPDAPVLRQRLNVPGAGEQMYVLDDHHVLLLMQYSENSEVCIVDVSGEPKITASLPVQGSIQESRLVGTALYVASQTYQRITNNSPKAEEWQWGTVVTSFDLAAPDAPIQRSTLWCPGYGNVVTATDKYLMIATKDVDTWKSTITVVDISSPDGTMSELSRIGIEGTVSDKFKMNVTANQVYGDVLAVVAGSSWQSRSNANKVETYSLADPRNPVQLASMVINTGESLFATRFDGDRVYVVTFLRVDPLWIVDLKNPAKPQLLGELQVPGWSTYIYPLGDRLVTVGIDNSNNWKVSVSLFDVSNPAKPGLLSQVPLGTDYSWSEANSNEKAFTVLPDAGLIMVPYQGWTTNGWAASVQLIDLAQDSLKARGTIEHSLQPRRTTQFADRVISISGSELLVVNAHDRDHPVVTAELELSWAVNRVVVAGNHLVEIENSSYWPPGAQPAIRVVAAANPDLILTQFSFTNAAPIVGASAQDNKLYVLQTRTEFFVGGSDTNPTPQPNLFLSVFDLGALPALPLIGYVESVASNVWSFASCTALWPRPGVLVWYRNGWRGPWLFNTDALNSFFWWGGGGAWLTAFNVANAQAPVFASSLNLSSTNNGWWNFSGSYAANGLIYSSHQGTEFVPASTNDSTKGVWITHHYLDVIDYADPFQPTVRAPIELPGQLIGVATNGALLYAKGPKWDAQGVSDGKEYLSASAYDGVQAFLVDSAPLWTNSWISGTPLLSPAGTLFLPTYRYQDSNVSSSIQAWQLNPQGKLNLLADHPVGAPISTLKMWGDLLGVQMSQTVEFYRVNEAVNWPVWGKGKSGGYSWPYLEDADGSETSGFYVPLSEYGLMDVHAQP